MDNVNEVNAIAFFSDTFMCFGDSRYFVRDG